MVVSKDKLSLGCIASVSHKIITLKGKYLDTITNLFNLYLVIDPRICTLVVCGPVDPFKKKGNKEFSYPLVLTEKAKLAPCLPTAVTPHTKFHHH